MICILIIIEKQWMKNLHKNVDAKVNFFFKFSQSVPALT